MLNLIPQQEVCCCIYFALKSSQLIFFVPFNYCLLSPELFAHLSIFILQPYFILQRCSLSVSQFNAPPSSYSMELYKGRTRRFIKRFSSFSSWWLLFLPQSLINHLCLPFSLPRRMRKGERKNEGY